MNPFKQFLRTRSRFPGILTSCRAVCSAVPHSSIKNTVEIHSQEQEVVIAFGSNVGDKLNNFNEALRLMKKSGIQVTRHAGLYETDPAYVTDQPRFLNSAVRAVTKLGPHELLSALKKIEKYMGRTGGIRYGPRPLDLDILFYGKFRISSDTLTVPHEKIWERPFVMAPLIDLIGSTIDNDTVSCWHSFAGGSGSLFKAWEILGGEALVDKRGMKRVLPIKDQLWDWTQKTSVMGILNVTPDSFSDGGLFLSQVAAMKHVSLMLSEGADIIDIGAQSTRPMASTLSAEEELDRLIPIIDAVVQMPEMEGKLVSVDTFYSQVASEAVKKGAHIINDVSAGVLDPDMCKFVSETNVPYIAMHMRGNPRTMQNPENLKYEDVCLDVASELCSRVGNAEMCGVPAWRIILDPGIGFSKGVQHNLELLMGLPKLRAAIARKSVALSHAPILIGPSRKKFLGDICSRSDARERDPATVASITAGVLGGANIVRVHNVRDNVDAARLCDAMLRR